MPQTCRRGQYLSVAYQSRAGVSLSTAKRPGDHPHWLDTRLHGPRTSAHWGHDTVARAVTTTTWPHARKHIVVRHLNVPSTSIGNSKERHEKAMSRTFAPSASEATLPHTQVRQRPHRGPSDASQQALTRMAAALRVVRVRCAP